MYDLNQPIEIHKWYLIINPFAGNKNFKKSWNKIQYLLKLNNYHSFLHITLIMLSMLNSFFIIVNPSSGNTNFKKSWEIITHFLKLKNINFSYSFTENTK